MRINGRISHCDRELLAGHSKAARGYDGLLEEVGRPGAGEAVTEAGSLPLLVVLIFRRGLWGDGVGPAMSSVTGELRLKLSITARRPFAFRDVV
jgi:hypothetical protein